MGQELGYISQDNTLIITTDDESFPVADLQSLVDEFKDVSSVQIRDIPKGLLQINQLKKLANIHCLQLAHSRVAVNVKEVAQLFSQLEMLSVSDCSNVDYSELSQLQNLKSLSVNGSGFTGQQIQAIPESVESLTLANIPDLRPELFEKVMPQLKELHLTRCRVPRFEKLLALIDNSQLNALSLESIQSVPQTLELGCVSLERVKIQECPTEQLTITSGSLESLELKWCYCLSKVTVRSTKLRTVALDNTNCKIEGLALAKDLQRITVAGGNEHLKDCCDNGSFKILVDSETMRIALQQGISKERLQLLAE